MRLKKLFCSVWCFCCIIMVLAVVSCGDKKKSPDAEALQPKDSITLWLEQAGDTTGQPKLRLLEKAYRAVSPLPEDTVKTKHLVELSYQYARTDDSITFRKISKEAIKITNVLKDTSRLTDVYWDLGDYFSRLDKNDSAYYYYAKAQLLYEKLNDDSTSAQMLINMAIRQINIRDYTGSEITTVKAIRLLQPLEEYEQLYSCYNNLGTIFNRLEDYNKAIEYYDQALNYLRKSGLNTLEPIIFNNIGVLYKNQGK